MKTFFKKYIQDSDYLFFRFIEIPNSTDLLFVGRKDNQGYVARVDADGRPVWEKTYRLGDQVHTLIQGWPLPKGDFLILGLIFTAQSIRHNYWLLRIDQKGNVRWSRQINSNASRTAVRFVPLNDGHFLITGWYNSGGDRVECIRVDPNGRAKGARVFQFGTDDQFNDVLPIGNELLFGGYSAHLLGGASERDGFLLRMDQQLNRPSAHWIRFAANRSQLEQVNALVALGGNQFVAAANYGGLYIARGTLLGNGGIQMEQPILANVAWDCGVRKMIADGPLIYLLGWDKKSLTQFVMKFDLSLSQGHRVWIKTFEADATYYLSDFIKNGDGFTLCGYFNENNINKPLLIRTDLELNCCATREISSKPSWFFRELIVEPARVNMQDLRIANQQLDTRVLDSESRLDERCPDKNFEPTENYLLQSPWVYLQAAGSVGAESAVGIHTRWFFRRKLGEMHLPKGNQAGTLAGLNKAEDFVCIYRAPYTPRYAELSIYGDPKLINDADRLWIFESAALHQHIFYLRFLDTGRYFQTRTQVNPYDNPSGFIDHYTSLQGLLEIELKDALCFAIKMTPKIDSSNFKCRVETFSVEGNIALPESTISNRLLFEANQLDQMRIVGENMNRIRYRVNDGRVTGLSFECYADFFQYAVDQDLWQTLGPFALTLDDAEAYLRLEDTSRMTVHNHWKKFNDNTTVDVPSYQARWTGVNPATGIQEDNGLKDGVQQYIMLSDDPANSKAQTSATEDGSTATQPDSINVAYLDLLNIAATDYHVARMLGLGHIDTDQAAVDENYIYLLEYHTVNSHFLDDQYAATPNLQHLYMSLPTDRQTQRLPQHVVNLPVEYGLSIAGSNPAYPVTDAQGYTPDGQVRFVNVSTRLQEDYSLSNGFFNPGTIFSLAFLTSPVYIGMEYRLQGAAWQEPELAHQQVFGHTENLPLVFFPDGAKPSLIHKETREGFHEYAAYPINIFSRAGYLSNIVATDETRFTIPNTLLPPHNLRVQLIQPEGPLVLTSQAEQDIYDNLPGLDKTLLRVTFDYSHLHDINYAFGEQVEFVFRQPLQRIVKGGIASIGSGDPVEISTAEYTYDSNVQEEEPVIPPGLEINFAGGKFVAYGEQFTIEQITQSGANPKLKVLKNQINEVIASGASSTVVQTLKGPTDQPDNLFMIQENLKKIESWDHLLTFKVDIGDSWTVRTETFVDEDGKTVSRDLRGIWQMATISKMKGVLIPGNGIPGPGGTPPHWEIIEGYYEIEFPGFQLDHHPQYIPMAGWYTGVDWHNGYVRVPMKNYPNKEWRALRVTKIENIGSGNLKLIAYDENFDIDTEVEAFDPNTWGGGSPTPLEVNFYPGYRVYLLADSTNGFDESTILPASGEFEKNTLFGARSKAPNPNSGGGPDYTSDIGTPQTITAEGIIVPVAPDEPAGPEYAPPPDTYSKAKYTFEVQLNQADPYALVFYRLDLTAVLHALYKDETIRLLKEKFGQPEEDEFFTSRWKSLMSWALDTDKGFAFVDGDRFPDPDKAQYYLDKGIAIPSYVPEIFKTGIKPGDVLNAGMPTEIKVLEVIKATVLDAATPILEKPLLYSSITQNKITPQHPAIKLAGNRIRFTDFTLDGEKITSYFYFAREMGSKNDFSGPSPIAGPIQLINTQPPKAPLVRKVTTQLADPLMGQDTAVRFAILGFPIYDKIRKIQVYRSLNELDARTVRTMTPVQEIHLDASEAAQEVIEIVDDFTSGGGLEIPYGEELYYRVVSLREVQYTKEAGGPLFTEYVPSLPTKAFKTRVVDSVNPEPPEITAHIGTTTPAEYQNVQLTWTKTAYNGRYTLFKMNSVGNWTKVFEIQSNDPVELAYTLPDPLPREDDGDAIYHRFKVSVENASGLLNLTEKIITI